MAAMTRPRGKERGTTRTRAAAGVNGNHRDTESTEDEGYEAGKNSRLSW